MSEFSVKRQYQDIEPQEVLLDKLSQKEEERFGVTERKIESPLSGKVVRIFFLSFSALVAFFFLKVFQLQVLEGNSFVLMAEKNIMRIKPIRADRGVVYDSSLSQLVWNKPSFDLILDKRDLPKDPDSINRIFSDVSRIIKQDQKEFRDKASQSRDYRVLILENIDHSTLIALEEKIDDLEGFEIENNTVREYFDGKIFSHVLGYTGKISENELYGSKGYFFSDYIGKTGLESYYEDMLRGEPGKAEVLKDAFGRIISKSNISDSRAGKSLVLWLDSGLQKELYNEILASLLATGGKKAAAVAIDPNTGGVLALVSMPGFDNNLFSQGMTKKEYEAIRDNPLNPLFNRAISGVGYPTGSTIKPLIGLAALETGIINASTNIYSPLKICIQNPWYKDKEDCYSDWKYHGWSDIRRAIAESVNTFFYQVGGGYEDFKGLGARLIKEWLAAFGWGAITGIDLPQEGKGILPDIENNWRLGDTYHLSIGQGPFAITPLQVATAYQAIANKGKVFRPKIVKEIVDQKNNPVEEVASEVLREVAAQKGNIEVIRQGMRQAVENPAGSSFILSSLPVKAAAKTGTAQTGKENYFHNWVTVFAPYDNPQIVLTIVIEDVQGEQVAALPAAKNVLNWYFSKY
ncbi:MAG: penicillin-binding protein 2 [Candidatus Nealsonbacteria bacterium]|nr:penicillin-binding protein 2 [Candidatus Nealsonbacteria bacterium]